MHGDGNGAALREAEALAERGDYAAAAGRFREAIASHPRGARAWAGLAECLLYQGDLDAAAACEARAYWLEPTPAAELRGRSRYASMGRDWTERHALARRAHAAAFPTTGPVADSGPGRAGESPPGCAIALLLALWVGLVPAAPPLAHRPVACRDQTPASSAVLWSSEGLGHPPGAEATLTLGNGATVTYAYDGASRVLGVRNAKSDGTVISSFQYGVDDVGNPTGMVLANGDRVTWTYHSLYRLTREQRSGANAYDVTYAFDGAGNRLTKVAGGVTTTYAYGAADALLVEDAAGARTTYSYDNAGNTTVAESAVGRTTYSWDGENRLSGIALPDGTVWTLSYDADGLRRRREEGANTVLFIWDGQRLLQETDSGGTTQAHYTAGLGAYGPILSMRRSAASRFLHPDHLGSVWDLTDASGDVTDSYLFDAWGNVLASSGSTTNPLQYVGALGYYRESALALDYVRARWLRPSTGSWLSVDPVAREPRCAYVRRMPAAESDASGRVPGVRPRKARDRTRASAPGLATGASTPIGPT